MKPADRRQRMEDPHHRISIQSIKMADTGLVQFADYFQQFQESVCQLHL